MRRLWCKRQDLARYDVGRAAGGVGMGKLMGVEQLFEGRHFDRDVKVDLRLQCGMPCSKLEVSTVQHGTLSGAGYLHQSP